VLGAHHAATYKNLYIPSCTTRVNYLRQVSVAPGVQQHRAVVGVQVVGRRSSVSLPKLFSNPAVLLLHGEQHVFKRLVGQARTAPTVLLQTIVKCAVILVIVLDVIPRYVLSELR